MAVVTRRYVLVGPTDAMLDQYVSPTGAEIAISSVYPTPTVDVDVDNAVTDLIATLDEYMAGLGYAPSATASPEQVFKYEADGTEANPFTIGAGQGFDARVTANYVVHVTLCRPAANAIKIVTVVDGSMTVNQFDVELSADIEDLT
jgi:hypothetical protein